MRRRISSFRDLAIDWSETVVSEGLRDRTPIERKLAGTTYTNALELGIHKDGIVIPGGLLARRPGQKS